MGCSHASESRHSRSLQPSGAPRGCACRTSGGCCGQGSRVGLPAPEHLGLTEAKGADDGSRLAGCGAEAVAGAAELGGVELRQGGREAGWRAGGWAPRPLWARLLSRDSYGNCCECVSGLLAGAEPATTTWCTTAGGGRMCLLWLRTWPMPGCWEAYSLACSPAARMHTLSVGCQVRS